RVVGEHAAEAGAEPEEVGVGVGDHALDGEGGRAGGEGGLIGGVGEDEPGLNDGAGGARGAVGGGDLPEAGGALSGEDAEGPDGAVRTGDVGDPGHRDLWGGVGGGSAVVEEQVGGR